MFSIPINTYIIYVSGTSRKKIYSDDKQKIGLWYFPENQLL